jgi:hypothetical protein
MHKLREKNLLILPLDFWVKKWYNKILIQKSFQARPRLERAKDPKDVKSLGS